MRDAFFRLAKAYQSYRRPLWLALERRLKRRFVSVEDRATGLRFRGLLGVDQMLGEIFHSQLYDVPTCAVRAGDLVIDVGANHGLASCYFAQRGAEVLAFEPSPTLFPLLVGNVGRNPLSGKVRLFQAAICDYDGKATLAESEEHGGAMNTLEGELARRSGATYQRRVEVECRAIGTVLAEIAPRRVRLLKLDCEGSELPILRAITQSERTLIDSIVLEFHPQAYPMPELIDELPHLGRVPTFKGHLAGYRQRHPPLGFEQGASGLGRRGPMKRLARRLLPPRFYDTLAGLWDHARSLHPERLLRRRRFLGLNSKARGAEIVLRPGLSFAVDPQARPSLEPFAFRSLEMARELDSFLALRDRFARLVDVGALHGVFSLAFTAGRERAHALAVEPSPLAWPLLTSNLALNPAARVRPFRLALGSSSGELAMRQDWHHLEALPPGASTQGAIMVPVRTLDELCASEGFAPDALKIDVEGFELEVLRGARQTLATSRPWLFLEVHPARLAELGGSTRQLLALLDEFGYRTLKLDAHSPADRLFATSEKVFRVVATPD